MRRHSQQFALGRRHIAHDHAGDRPIHRDAGHPRPLAQRFSPCGERRGAAVIPLDLEHRLGIARQEFRLRRLDDQFAAMDDADGIAYPFDVGQDVRGHKDGTLAAQSLDEFQHLLASDGIERAGRLVQKEHAGPVDQRLGQR